MDKQPFAHDLPHLIKDEVRDALQQDRPVVALESTLIAHGLPYPDNVATALAIEAAVRAAKAVPATIAILSGRICIGLSDAQLEQLGSSSAFEKTNRAELPAYLSTKRSAATTVSATIWLAHLAGIAFFATGGIGGVHRGESWDISADLTALATTPMLVVCSGCKNILDFPRTFELLETLAIPVVGFQTQQWPAFYLADSGIELSHFYSHIEDIAAFYRLHQQLHGHGMLVVQPPPFSTFSSEQFSRWLHSAEATARQQNITGKAVTPFLLQQLHDLSGGLTLKVNQALAVANAQLAAAVAVAHQNCTSEHSA